MSRARSDTGRGPKKALLGVAGCRTSPEAEEVVEEKRFVGGVGGVRPDFMRTCEVSESSGTDGSGVKEALRMRLVRTNGVNGSEGAFTLVGAISSSHVCDAISHTSGVGLDGDNIISFNVCLVVKRCKKFILYWDRCISFSKKRAWFGFVWAITLPTIPLTFPFRLCPLPKAHTDHGAFPPRA